MVGALPATSVNKYPVGNVSKQAAPSTWLESKVTTSVVIPVISVSYSTVKHISGYSVILTASTPPTYAEKSSSVTTSFSMPLTSVNLYA